MPDESCEVSVGPLLYCIHSLKHITNSDFLLFECGGGFDELPKQRLGGFYLRDEEIGQVTFERSNDIGI